MKIAKIEKNSVANGPGIRVVIWCQGCSLHCKGCHNPETWNSNGGKYISLDEIGDIYKELEKPWIRGLTFSGGHPLEDYNIEECTNIAKSVKEFFQDKDIWLYTGLLWEDIKDFDIFNYVDVVVDGPYIEEERNIMLPYCGSNNQRVIDVKKSIASNEVVIYENL